MFKFSANLVLTLFVSLNASIACANIYGYTDEAGVINLTDSQPNDDYQLLIVSPIESKKTNSNLVLHEEADKTAPQANALKPRFNDEVKNASENSGVESALLHAVITAESNYNSKALSPKGARGLMQLMPVTAKRFGVNNIYDPRQNIQGGARYLSYLLKLFNNDLRLTVAAYNAGENAVIRHGNKVPPYSETVNYVSKVMGLYKKLRTA
ncbi:MAG: lytic transglycosylase domain-containing protein [Methylotenera sp.]